MKKHTTSVWIIPLFFALAWVALEILLRLILSVQGSWFVSIALTLALALAVIAIGSFFRKPWFLVAVFALVTFYYLSQYVYHTIFKTFYTLYSMGEGGQVLQFWKDVVRIVFINWWKILLLILPLGGFVFYSRKRTYFLENKKLWLMWLPVSVVLLLMLSLGGVDPRIEQSISNYGLISGSFIAYSSSLELGEELPFLNEAAYEETYELTSGAERPLPVTAEAIKVWDPASLVDFSSLAQLESNENIKKLHTYFAGLPLPEANAHTGLFKGYNVIYITAESFSHLAVRQDLTPTLYKLVNEGYRFTNFYNPVWEVSTSDGEYVNVSGLLPKSGVWSLKESAKNAMPLAMGNALRRIGYTTQAYHNHTYTYYDRHKSHPNLGYDYKGVGNGLVVKETWPESDLEMIQVTLPEFIDKQPFHTYYISVSGHMLYTFSGNYMSSKHRDKVDHLELSNESKAYLACQIEFDLAMKSLLEQLEAKGIAEKTLIVIAPDHYPYGLSKEAINELSGHEVEQNFELYRSALVIYAKGMEKETIDRPVSSLDILPTVYNLLEYPYDSRLLMGTDAFSDRPPLVMFLNHSFITDKGRYNVRDDSWTGEDLGRKYVEDKIVEMNNKFRNSRRILDYNYYKYVFK